jgi:hypothetical protein
MNEYQSALASVASVLMPYDSGTFESCPYMHRFVTLFSDQMIPAYGFGAKVNGQTSHCFPLNFNLANPEVPSIPGLLAAYQNAITQVKLCEILLLSLILLF